MASTSRDLVKLALAPSETERDKAARTHNSIREYLESDPALKKYSVDTYLQGSYKNSTNVRGDSDVDMGAVTQGMFYYDTSELPNDRPTYPSYATKSLREATEASITPASYTFSEYRRDVLASLKREYGSSVTDGKKAISIAGNTYRLDADVLPCTLFRWYYKDWRGEAKYHEGISFFTNGVERIVNFPQQHFDNLKAKDQANDGKVKGCIRILKRVRNELEEAKQWDRKRSPSYYLEGLVWNVPDKHFEGNYYDVVPAVLQYLWRDLTDKRESGDLTSYNQANDIFYLFHSKFWNVNDAIAFIETIWRAVFPQ
jgi:hypothetical protein